MSSKGLNKSSEKLFKGKQDGFILDKVKLSFGAGIIGIRSSIEKATINSTGR